MHRHLGALGRLLSVADDDVVDTELEGDVSFWLVDLWPFEWQRGLLSSALRMTARVAAEPQTVYVRSRQGGAVRRSAHVTEDGDVLK